jgi:hypothetical protein
MALHIGGRFQKLSYVFLSRCSFREARQSTIRSFCFGISIFIWNCCREMGVFSSFFHR